MKLSILTDLFSQCFWWLLFWMFLAFLLGWLLRKLFGGSDADNNCCDELDSWKRKYKDLEARYNKLKTTPERVETVPNISASGKKRAKKTSSSTKTSSKKGTSSNKGKSNASNFSDSNSSSNASTSFVAGGDSATKSFKTGNAYGKLKEDNLQIIEGIGPKMEEVLKKNSIGTWKHLAGNTPSELRMLLDNENPTRYKIIDPTTWSDQAQLAVNGKWEELIAMQKDLDTGKTDTTGSTPSKLEKMMQRLGLIKKWKQDDLKAIEGIGPKIAGLLKESGIATWNALSKTSVDTLKEILEKAGPRFKLADPGTWPKQAQLADEGKWDELQEYQDFLDGGK